MRKELALDRGRDNKDCGGPILRRHLGKRNWTTVGRCRAHDGTRALARLTKISRALGLGIEVHVNEQTRSATAIFITRGFTYGRARSTARTPFFTRARTEAARRPAALPFSSFCSRRALITTRTRRLLLALTIARARDRYCALLAIARQTHQLLFISTRRHPTTTFTRTIANVQSSFRTSSDTSSFLFNAHFLPVGSICVNVLKIVLFLFERA